jgi:xanthine dehydrogenase accessory factor
VTRFHEQMAAAAAAARPFALALIADTRGSSPQRVGAKALFHADGTITGTLGGGCLEAEVQARALRALQTSEPARFDLVLDHDFGWDDGLICGGSVSGLILPQAALSASLWQELARITTPVRWGVRTDFSIARCEWYSGPDGWIYQETVSPPAALWIAGSGHVAQAVAPLATQLDFAVTVLDDRPDLVNHQFFPPNITLLVAPWHDLIKLRPPSATAFGLIVTRGHQHDALVLSEWIGFPFAFLGMIGSRRKARIMRDQFLRQKLATPERFDRVACPVGVDIAAVGPAEIAMSVVAQLIQQRAGLRAKP